MGVLFKKGFRDLWESRGQFAAALVIVIIGVACYTGINSSFRNIKETSTKYYQDYRFADLTATFLRAPESILSRIDALPYVQKSAGRLVRDVKLTLEGENATLRLITLPDTRQETVNDIVIKTGRYFSSQDSNQCLVEEEFFRAHGLQTGDTISPVINGNEVKLRVIGAVKSPEYVYPLRDAGEMVPDNKRFGIVYVKKSFGQAILGYNGSINNICVTLNNPPDMDNVKEDFKKILDQFGLLEVVEKKDQLSNKNVNDQLNQLEASGQSFPVLFFIVAAVIIYITMGRLVENQRTQIGVLKAFGYGNMKILSHYLSYPLLIGTLGSILGIFAGMYLGQSLTELQNDFFHLPSAQLVVYTEYAVPALLLTLFFCLLAGYRACRTVLRIMPGEAMRPKAPVIGKKILLERVSVIWKRMGSMWKIVLRNLFRYKRRALLTSTGIIFTTAMLMIGFGSNDTVDFMLDQQYRNIMNYDIRVDFTRFVNAEELYYIGSLSHVERLEPLVQIGVEAVNGWRKKNIALTALERDAALCKVTNKDGEEVRIPETGVLLPERMGRILGVGAGDVVTLKPFLPDKEKKEVLIKGTIVQYMGTSAYSSMDYLSALLGEGRIANAAVLTLDRASSEKEVLDRLREIPGVASVQSKYDTLNNFKKTMSSMSSFYGMMVILAGSLAFSVVYNITNINIYERKRELATLKVLGFKEKEVQRVIFNENFIITLFGILAGLPIGYWLLLFILYASSTDDYTLPAEVKLQTYVVTAVLTILFTLLANLVLVKKIKSIDMVEVLKSNE